MELTKKEREQIAEILNRRANEIASFTDDYRRNDTYYGSVEMALSREIGRLRMLADKVDHEDSEDDE